MKRLQALLVTLALLAVPLVGRADIPVFATAFSSTAAAGSFIPSNPAGASVCTITFTSGGGSTVTVLGAADATVGGTYKTNINFGTNGVITAPATNSVFAGNVSKYPLGFNLSWTGNAGTLSGTWVCSGASGLSDAGSSSNVTIVNTPPVQTVIGSNTGPILPHICDKFFSVSITSATTTAIISAIASRKVYLCDAEYILTGTNTTSTVQLEFGTKTTNDCDTGTTTYGGAYLQSGTIGTFNRNTLNIIFPQVFGLLFAPASNEVCVVTTGTVNINFFGWYAQDPN